MNKLDSCHANCSFECPDSISCPYDSTTPMPTKDRSTRRSRHHSEEKAKRDAKQTLGHVSSKAANLSENATQEQHLKAEKKCKNVDKKIHNKRTE